MKPYILKREFLAGLTTSMAMIPESMAFAMLAALSPMIGLYSALIVGLVAAIIGRPALISGGAGAIVIVSAGLVADRGVEYLFAAVVVMGIIQLVLGLIKVAKLLKFVTKPIMNGFLNGLAIIIFTSQFVHFKSSDGGLLPKQYFIYAVGITLFTFLIFKLGPKIFKSVPAGLLAIGTITLCVFIPEKITGIHAAKTIGDVASISGGLPKFHVPMPPINLETLWIILPYAFVMAIVGLLESLLTMKVVDEELDEVHSSPGNPDTECIAQGSANLLCGFFGGMGGCGMIGQTIINLESRGKTRWSGIFMALCILMFVLFAAPIVEKIPVAALAAVMFAVAIKAFQWHSLKVNNSNWIDFLIMLIVTAVTLISHNLALAVFVGVFATWLYKRLGFRQSAH